MTSRLAVWEVGYVLQAKNAADWRRIADSYEATAQKWRDLYYRCGAGQ